MNKNLANCKPSEFLVQTNKIRKAVEKWLTITDLKGIRKRMPPVKEGQTAEDRRKEIESQAMKNLSAMLDSIMEEHPEETLELLALMCFVEPENVDDYPISFYLGNFSEIIRDQAVLSFFTSLIQLGQMNILTA